MLIGICRLKSDGAALAPLAGLCAHQGTYCRGLGLLFIAAMKCHGLPVLCYPHFVPIELDLPTMRSILLIYHTPLTMKRLNVTNAIQKDSATIYFFRSRVGSFSMEESFVSVTDLCERSYGL